MSPGALLLADRAIAILIEAGFNKRDAVRVYRVLFLYTFGSAAFASSERRASESAQSRAVLAALDSEQYPVLADVAVEAAETVSDRAVFEFGLDRLIAWFRMSAKGARASDSDPDLRFHGHLRAVVASTTK
jgi:hypothetical protein